MLLEALNWTFLNLGKHRRFHMDSVSLWRCRVRYQHVCKLCTSDGLLLCRASGVYWQGSPPREAGHTWCPGVSCLNKLHCPRHLQTIFQFNLGFHYHAKEASGECNQSGGKLKWLTIFVTSLKVGAKFKHFSYGSFIWYHYIIIFYDIH